MKKYLLLLFSLVNCFIYGVAFAGIFDIVPTPPGKFPSTDFVGQTIAQGLGSNDTRDIFAANTGYGNFIYVATANGLTISRDDGITFTNRTRDQTFGDQLGSNDLYGIYFLDGKLYVATAPTDDAPGGLSIAPDINGTVFINRTHENTNNTLGSNDVRAVFAGAAYVFAATSNLKSDDGGISWTNDLDNYNTFTNNLFGLSMRGVCAVSPNIYTVGYSNLALNKEGGLWISSDGGKTFSLHKTRANGLGSSNANHVFVDDDRHIYVATSPGDDKFPGSGGLSISTNGGSSFTNYTLVNGLGSNDVQGIYVSDGIIFAGTNANNGQPGGFFVTKVQ